MSQFRENLRTNGRMDKPYFIGPFRPRPGVQKENKQITDKMIRDIRN